MYMQLSVSAGEPYRKSNDEVLVRNLHVYDSALFHL